MVLTIKGVRELALKEQLNNIDLAINKLQEYQNSSLSDLPEELLRLVKGITVLPSFSSTGLEDVNSILNNLYICRFIAKKVLSDEPLPGEPEYNMEPIIKQTTESQNIVQNAPRPRPKFVESKNPPATTAVGHVRRGIKTEEPKNIGMGERKQDQPLINLQDISHIEPSKPKQITPNPLSKKQDPLDPFDNE